jgi:hypothetical protein
MQEEQMKTIANVEVFSAQVLYGMAIASHRLNRISEAQEYLNSALAAAPATDPFRNQVQQELQRLTAEPEPWWDPSGEDS